MTMRRILVTGSRDWDNVASVFEHLTHVMRRWGTDLIVIHGGAKGADTIAGQWASVQFVQEEVHPADWENCGNNCGPDHYRYRNGQPYCPRAGFVRNSKMVELGADICLAFIKNNSKGATMCADLAEKSGIPTVRIKESE